MKCPKCHYLSFDPEPRCRNCGYTLALDPDLAIRPEPARDSPLVDLTLRDASGPGAAPVRDEAPRPTAPRRTPAAHAEPVRRARTTMPGPFDEPADASPSEGVEGLDDDRMQPAAPTSAPPPTQPTPPPAEGRPRRQAPSPTTELPLFVKGIGEVASAPMTARLPDVHADEPSIDLPAELSPPVSARREPAEPRPRTRGTESPRFGPLDRDLLEGLQRIEHAEQRQAAAAARRELVDDGVGASRRLGAAAVDALFLGALAAGIVSVTLRWTDLTWNQLQVLPMTPMLIFVLLVVTGYLVIFTAASGQTAGKMLMGIRVVDAGPPGNGEDRVSVRQALYRGALTVPSVLLLGAGFLPALGGDGRAIHDRLTQTRVVRA
jgi:uncharacterized RDD family membrane protein YckC